MSKLSGFCDIIVNKPTRKAFAPGDVVSGAIRYEIDEKFQFNKIIITLKGLGRLTLKSTNGAGKKIKEETYFNSEDYVNKETVVEDVKGKGIRPGKYEKLFSFALPDKIPSSLNFSQSGSRFKIQCSIVYYINVEFIKPDIYSKRFNEEITLLSGIVPRLTVTPISYMSSKKVFQIFNKSESLVNITGTVQNSVIAKGGKLDASFEIINNSDRIIKAVKTKLVSVYTFYTTELWGVKVQEDVEGTEVKHGQVSSGGQFSSKVEINLPTNLNSIEYSKFVTRDYAVLVIASLQAPHNSAILEMPFQVGDKIASTYPKASVRTKRIIKPSSESQTG